MTIQRPSVAMVTVALALAGAGCSSHSGGLPAEGEGIGDHVDDEPLVAETGVTTQIGLDLSRSEMTEIIRRLLPPRIGWFRSSPDCRAADSYRGGFLSYDVSNVPDGGLLRVQIHALYPDRDPRLVHWSFTREEHVHRSRVDDPRMEYGITGYVLTARGSNGAESRKHLDFRLSKRDVAFVSATQMHAMLVAETDDFYVLRFWTLAVIEEHDRFRILAYYDPSTEYGDGWARAHGGSYLFAEMSAEARPSREFGGHLHVILSEPVIFPRDIGVDERLSAIAPEFRIEASTDDPCEPDGVLTEIVSPVSFFYSLKEPPP